MSAPKVLAAGVCLILSLYAAEPATQANSAWLARQNAGEAALQQHRYPDAAQIFGESVTLAANSTERATSLASYGTALAMGRRNEEARPALERSVAEWANTSDASRVLTSGVLASVYRNLGDYRGAERVLRTAISDPLGKQEDRAVLMVGLADLLREEGADAEAIDILSEAGRLGAISPEQQIRIMIEAAQLLRDMQRWDDSIAVWTKIASSTEVQNSPRLHAIATDGLGETWFAAGNLARAEPLLRRAVSLMSNDPETAPSQLSATLSALAHLYIDQDKLALAEDALTQAITKDEASLGPDHPQIGVMLELKAMILSRRGEPQLARGELERAKTIMSSHFGPQSVAVAAVFAGFGDVEARAGQRDTAVLEYGAAVRMLQAAGRENTGFGPTLVERYAAALKAAHRGNEARDLLKSLRAALTAGATPGAAALTAAAQSFRQ